MEKPPHRRLIVSVPVDLITAVEDFRYADRCPSMSEAVKRLLTRGLAASHPTTRRKPSDAVKT